LKSPFNEAKYRALLEGLEISEILKSDLEYSGRIDSEYYKKHLLFYENQIRKNSFSEFGKMANFLIGPFGSSFDTENYVKNGDYRYVRGQDVKPFILKDGENRFVPFEDFERLKKYALKEKDILVSVVGTLGNACIVQKKDLPAIFSCKSTVIRTTAINSIYALTFLNCKYGRELLIRKERGAIQKGLNLDDLKSTIIPIFSDAFQIKIDNVFYNAQSKITESKSLYQSAENLLLQTIGLKNFKQSNDSVNVKNFKDSFLATGRLDAEYYQKKYEQVETSIKKNSNCDVLGNLLINIDTGEYASEYYNKGEIPDLTFYIRSTNIKGGLIEYDDNYYVKKIEFVKKAKPKDIVTARVGSIGVFGEIRNKMEGAVYSDNVLCFRLPETFIPSVFVLLFNSKMYFELVDKLARGSVQQRVNQETLKDLIIPILDYPIQERIATLIEESFRLKKESEKILETAKRAVEIAIEVNEYVAMEYIHKEMQGITGKEQRIIEGG
jgi:restriction endonuclease S subunit